MVNLSIMIIWLVLVAGGMGLLLQYQSTPGTIITVADLDDIKVVQGHCQQDQQHMLFFLHPGCPCSRASVAEMARLLTRHPMPVSVVVSKFDEDYQKAISNTLGNVNFVVDPTGKIQQMYQAHTSGHIVFLSHGQVLYAGGITASRGHEGGNVFSDMLEHCIQQQVKMKTNTLVFGCDL